MKKTLHLERCSMATTETKGGKDQGLVQDSQDRERMLSRRQILRIGWTVPVVAMVTTPRGFASIGSCGGTKGAFCNQQKAFPVDYDPDQFVIGGTKWYRDIVDIPIDQRPSGSNPQPGIQDPAWSLVSPNGALAWPKEGSNPPLHTFKQLIAADLNHIYYHHTLPNDPTLPYTQAQVLQAINEATAWYNTNLIGAYEIKNKIYSAAALQSFNKNWEPVFDFYNNYNECTSWDQYLP
jgi:hypothetical protein